MSLILVVDDEPGVRETVRDWLTATGYEVETVGDAAGTLQWFETCEAPPDAVLLDVKLPDANGFQVADKLVERHGYTKVIFMTAFFWEEETREQLVSRGVPYFEKPLKFSTHVVPFLERFLAMNES